jgi:hypothetical protein
VDAGSEELGSNVAVRVDLLYDTVPITLVPHVRVNVLVLTDSSTTGSLKTALTDAPRETPVAPFAGFGD